jgi:ankyrin repeat protein
VIDQDPQVEALFEALFAKDAAGVRAALAAGASPDASTRRRPPKVPSARWGDRAQALVVATALGDLESMRVLLDAGASPEARIWQERSSPVSDWDYEEVWAHALGIACAEGKARAASLLLERGARKKKVGYRGSVMELAVRYGHVGAARALIRHGIFPGKRVTREAIVRGMVPMVRVLVEAGGLSQEDALAYARKKGVAKVVAVLEVGV